MGHVNLRLIDPISEVPQIEEASEISSITNKSIAIKTSDLKRGELVEFKVRLTADPIFRLGTMATEFSGMLEDFPELFAAHNAIGPIKQIEPINRILQRFLAGLIPIKATAVDYCVVTVDDIEYIVHRDSVSSLDLQIRPLEIVGVTEHLAYWRDIRRVLFSEAEFTMLCRIGRDGLQSSWTPVKLADLLLPVAPDLVKQMHSACEETFNKNEEKPTPVLQASPLKEALVLYKNSLIEETNQHLSSESENSIDQLINTLEGQGHTATSQKHAFSEIYNKFCELTEETIDQTRNMELRQQARETVDLSLFPSTTNDLITRPSITPSLDNNERLLDAEVVAIYW